MTTLHRLITLCARGGIFISRGFFCCVWFYTYLNHTVILTTTCNHCFEMCAGGLEPGFVTGVLYVLARGLDLILGFVLFLNG
jgi:hypothetical protein